MDESISRATGAPAVGDDPFDAYYFANCCGLPYRRDDHWLGFFGKIAERIDAGIRPRRVLDAGCALGILVETLRGRGIDAEGIDLSSYAIANVHEPIRPFCRQGSIASEFTGRYDLIVSIEVLEHVPVREGEEAIANFCRHTDDVLFSSTPSDHREPSHVNVQPAEYWAEQFARHGFYRDVDFDASFVTPWAVRFRRGREPLPRIVRDYERRFAALEAARNDARAFSIDVQRDLARERERGAARDAEAAQRDALQQTLTHLSDLARALDDQRLALLESRGHLEAERQVVATERLALERDRVAAEHERAAFERERDARREWNETEIEGLRTSIEETHAHLNRKVLALDVLEAQAASLRADAARHEHDLRHARETIARMEQSVFWRLRGLWAGISRALGRPT
jgi:cyclopropane fatty-acyl-phospholipid synthase-like methyltransferase